MKKKRIYFYTILVLLILLGVVFKNKKNFFSSQKEEKNVLTSENNISIESINIPEFSKQDQESFKKFYSYTTEGVEIFLEENKELKAVKTIFYPFSGGDILYPLTIFPNVENIFLISIEPLGNKEIKTFETLSENTRSLMERSFLVTRDMRSTLSDDFGIINMIVEELAVLGVEKFVIHEFNTQEKYFLISFTYKNKERKIFYFVKNINNFLFDTNFFKELLKNYKFDTVMLKSASYLMFEDKIFSKVKNFLLENFNMIVQDDSGIPYSALKKKYSVKLIGEYRCPYGKEFKRFYQKELAKLKPSSQNVIKCYGYGGGKVKPNVVIATKN